MQLHPRESFVITHQLNNSYITDTSYVRAVIRNAKTDTILDTLDLTDKGDGRFTTEWQVPADASGQGFWVSIITSVYSDSGYTTKSQNYGDEANTYLVQERFNHNLGGVGGGGGPDIDYKKIRKIIKEEIGKIDFPEVEIEPVIVTNIKEIIKEVKVPEIKVVESFKEMDISSLQEGIKEILKETSSKKSSLDLSPLFAYLKNVEGATKALHDRIDNLKLKPEADDKEEETSDIRVSKFLGKKVGGVFDPRVIKLIKTK